MKRSVKQKREHQDAGCTLCLSKLEHLTPDRWLISDATRLPSQIIIRQFLESLVFCVFFFFYPLACTYVHMTKCFGLHLLTGPAGGGGEGLDALSPPDCPSSAQSRGLDWERCQIS